MEATEVQIEKHSLAELRQAKKMSQWDVALAVGVAGGTVSHWERKLVAPSPEYLEALADLFDVSPEELDVASPRRSGRPPIYT